MYFIVNLGRLNLSAVISAIGRSEGMSKDSLGLMVTLFFFTYGLGQLVCGVVAERVSPILLIAAGVFLASAANIGVSLSSSAAVMQLCWFANGIGQAFIWIPMARILAEYLPGEQCVRACLYISVTGPVAMFCIYALSALFLRFFSWRAVFLFSGTAIFAAAFLWIGALPWLLKGMLKIGSIPEEPIQETPAGVKANKHWSLKRLFSTSGLGLLIIVSCLHGILKDGFNTWLPTYFVDNFLVHESISVILTMGLPLMSLIGIYLARKTTILFSGNESYSAIFFFSLAAAILFGLWILPNQLWISLFFFACAAILMTALNTLLITLMPLQYVHTGRMTTVIGMLNTATYLGSSIAGYGFGNTAEYLSWNIIRLIWCVLALTGAAFCLGVRKRWNRFKASKNFSF